LTYDRFFDLLNIKILFQPLLLRMEAKLIVPLTYELLDLLQIHEISYIKGDETSTTTF